MKTFYSWGADRLAGQTCPALAAGYSMDDTTVRRVAELYDQMASHYPQADDGAVDEGIIEATDARSAWLSTIERLHERITEGYHDVDRLHAAALIYRNEWGDSV